MEVLQWILTYGVGAVIRFVFALVRHTDFLVFNRVYIQYTQHGQFLSIVEAP